MSGLDLKPIYDKPGRGDIKKSQSDITLVKELIGWVPQIALEEGMKKPFSINFVWKFDSFLHEVY